MSVDMNPVETMFLDWWTFWAKDRREADWLVEDVVARGRGHAIYAPRKSRKSLFTLGGIVLPIVRTGHVVVYLDYEMGEDDLYDRLVDMGIGADTDLERLYYGLLPSLPPLDQPEGGKALLVVLDEVQAQNPDEHIVVVIDTTARAVIGEENSADTIRNFYRWTGTHLKARGHTWLRLDHAGKDSTRGQRGSSAKGDDVDVVWCLTATEGGVDLRRDAARMSWVPERVSFTIGADPLRFVRTGYTFPAGTKEVADHLDTLGVPIADGERPAGKALRDAGHKATQSVVRAAQRYRRDRDAQGSR